jgi:hypothetical protein
MKKMEAKYPGMAKIATIINAQAFPAKDLWGGNCIAIKSVIVEEPSPAGAQDEEQVFWTAEHLADADAGGLEHLFDFGVHLLGGIDRHIPSRLVDISAQFMLNA